MRFLATNHFELPILQFAAKIMRPCFVTGNLMAKPAARPRQTNIGCSHHLQQNRTRENEEGHERRNRISGKSENPTMLAFTKQKRFSRLHRHTPEINLGTNLLQRFTDEIALTDRNTATDDSSVVLRGVSQRLAKGIEVIATMSSHTQFRTSLDYECCQHHTVALENLAATQFFSRR